VKGRYKKRETALLSFRQDYSIPSQGKDRRPKKQPDRLDRRLYSYLRIIDR